MKFAKKFSIIMLALIVSGVFFSCRKKADTIANIYVRDETNAIVDPQ